MNQLKPLIRRIWGPFSARRSAWRLGLQLLPWLIFLGVPCTRAQFARGVTSAFRSPDDGPDIDVASVNSLAALSCSPAGQYALRLLAPNNIMDDRVAYPLEALSSTSELDISLGQKLKSMDRSGRLGWHPSTNGGPFSWDQCIEPYVPSPAFANPSAAVKRRQQARFRELLGNAEAGGKLEPHNSFFDWCTARCLFALSRDSEALAVLHRAAAKPTYDSHLREATLARRKVLASVAPDNVLMLDDGDFDGRYAMTGFDWTQFRHTVQLATVAAARLEQAGQNARALSIYGDLITLCASMRDGSYTIQEADASSGLAVIVWGGLKRELTPRQMQVLTHADDSGADKWIDPVALSFAHYAAGHGRRDLAAQARREAPRFAATALGGMLDIASNWPITYDSSFAWIECWIFMLSAVVATWLIVMLARIVTFVCIVPGSLAAVEPRAKDVAPIVISVLKTTLIYIAIWLFLTEQDITVGDKLGQAIQDLASQQIYNLGGFICTLAILALAPVMLMAARAAIAAVRRQRSENPAGTAPRKSFFDWQRHTPETAVSIACWSPVAFADFSLLGLAVLLFSGHTSRKLNVPVLGAMDPESMLWNVMAISLSSAVIGWLLRWRWWPEPRYRGSAHYALGCYRQALSWWSVLLGWCAVAVVLAMIPSYQSIERSVDHALAIGPAKTMELARASGWVSGP